MCRWGLVKADNVPIKVIIPKGGEATITFTSSTKGFVVSGDKSKLSYPLILNLKGKDSQEPLATAKSSTEKAVYEIKADKDQAYEVYIQTGVPADDEDKWGAIGITVDGKVSEFTINKDNKGTAPTKTDSKLLQYINLVKFTDDDATLTSLKLGSSSTNTDYLPALTFLTIPDNRLTYIPAKTDKMTKYSIGKVEWKGNEYAGYGDSNTAKSFLLYPEKLFEHAQGIYNNLKDIQQNELQIVALKDAEGNDITSYATGNNWDQAKSFYHFRNANGVYDKYGVFTADIKILNENYKDVVLSGVKLNVKQATFKLTIDNPDENKVAVKVTVNGENFDSKTETLTYGQQFALSAVSQDGYQFAGFEVEKGATVKDQQGDSHYFIVDGDDDIVIKVKSEASSNKVIFEQDPAGTLEVLSGSGRLTSGSAIATGEELTIKAEAKEGFEIEKVEIGDNDVTSKGISDDKCSFNAIVKVPVVEKGKDIVIKVTYKAKAYRLTIIRPSADANGELSNFSIKDKSNGKEVKVTYTDEIGAANVLAGTQLEVTISLKDEQVANDIAAQINGEKQAFRKDGKGIYIIDYTMPGRSAKLVVDFVALKPIIVTLNEDELAYNGQPQQITSDMYTVEVGTDADKKVVNMTGFKPLTYASSDKATEWTTKAYDAIGTYYVRFQRDADAQYQAVDQKVKYEIKGVQLVITDLPTVKVIEKEGKDTYEITGGQVGYQQGDKMYSLSDDEMAKAGKFELVDPFDATAKSVKVLFKVNADNKNILTSEEATVALVDKDGKSATIEVEVNEASAPGLIMMNGGAEVHNGDKLADGTTLAFDVKDAAPEAWTDVIYEVYRVEKEGNIIKKEEVWPSDTKGYEIDLDGKDGNGRELLSFLLEVKDNRTQPVLDENKSNLKQYVVYDGEAQMFNLDYTKADTAGVFWNDSNKKVLIEKSGDGVVLYDAANQYWNITYKQGSNIVPEPINAGTYEVILTREDSRLYKAIEEVKATLIVLPKKLAEAEIGDVTPKASAIGAGSPLSDSELTGTPNIAGKYVWAENDASVDKTGSYRVKFVPEDKNYAEVELTKTVKVEVTDKYILTYSNPDGLGIVEVRDAYGIVPSGSTLKEGTQLYLTAKPKDATKVRLVSIDGVSVSYSETGVTNAPFKFTGKMDIKAYFEVIEQEVIDPSTQYVVTVNTSGRGFEVDKVGDFGVLREGDFSFTVKALAADMSKIVVKTSRGETLTGKNGVYTIEEVTENMSVNVSLPNPTEIKVEIPAEYENEGGYKIGTVQVEGSIDGKYYYGDVITVIAIPVDGTNFEKWSDGSKEQVHEIALYKDTTLKATFKGVPTGIEDIESASISTGRGFILVKNAVHADVKVISISGRLQAQQEVNGDTRIDVPQGIYVVVLESGSGVKRVKVIVK